MVAPCATKGGSDGTVVQMIMVRGYYTRCAGPMGVLRGSAAVCHYRPFMAQDRKRHQGLIACQWVVGP